MIRPGQRVLDIGSGWGGLALHLAGECGAEVTGLTLSVEQHKTATRRAAAAGLSDRVRFHLRDYREESGQYDRIVSVGMFEHVGINHYGTFFAKVKSLLTPDGVALLHSIGRMDGPGSTHPWIRKYIFPGGYAPALSEVVPVVERLRLWITDIEILRLHYAHTLRLWRRRFEQNRDRLRTIYDERFCRMWEMYLAGSEVAFRRAGHLVFQMQLAKTHRCGAVDPRLHARTRIATARSLGGAGIAEGYPAPRLARWHPRQRVAPPALEEMMGYEHILVEREDGVGDRHLEPSRQAQRDEPPALERIARRGQGARRDEAIGCIVLTGAGDRAFSAGGDIHEQREDDRRFTQEELDQRRGRGSYEIAASAKPTIGMLNGLAYGGAAVLASSLDLRVGCEDTRFRFLAAAYGRINSTWTLPNQVGWPIAKELLFTARVVEADEAYRIGLLNHLVPRERAAGQDHGARPDDRRQQPCRGHRHQGAAPKADGAEPRAAMDRGARTSRPMWSAGRGPRRPFPNSSPAAAVR